jgi:ferredoxin
MLSLTSKRSGQRMPTPLLLHIPLSSAYLCQDCNSIGNCARQCPACASEVLMSLSGVLNREVESLPHVVPQPSYGFGTAMVA